ncbi:hypothetical protein G7077_11640 [Sphingomonas piscis]|uniref:Glycosyltransferase RgtA/B/C/D-like domain-containing protein n=1 Tax=Sphingomonas piscis TaxID=2714943 RepID=A0A6G7YRU8_9SPHN|nr:hypothetical protein [Sphingomonas piscis]QIK79459.1 hypothetical protein G7077_11640 [Sphingomonas piscis]
MNGELSIAGTPRATALGGRLGRVFSRGDSLIAEDRSWRTAVAALLLLQTTMVFSHAAWLDEWQALQIALQSPDLSALLENLRYEGHPPLWYALLRIAGWFIPYLWVLAGIQFAVALGMQALILLRAPFTRLERLLLGSSYFILFEFGTLSRGLSLGAFLTIALFAAKDKRLRWATIILLPLVDFLFGLISLIGIMLALHDKRFSRLGAGLWLASSLLAAWSIIPAPDIRPALATPHVLYGLFLALNNLSALLIPFQTLDGQIGWGGGLPGLLGPVGGLLFLLFALSEIRDVKLHGWLFRLFFLLSIAFTLFIYPLGIRHLTLIPLLVILFKWREVEAGGATSAWFKAWLAVLAAGGAAVVAISVDRPFDSAPEVAKFITANNLQDKHWVSYPDSLGQAVSGLIDREFETPPKGCTQSFIRWDRGDPSEGINNAAELDKALRKVASNRGRFYLISSYDLDDRITIPFRKIAHFGKAYDRRDYFIYVVAPALPEKAPARPCPPKRVGLSQAWLLAS